MTSRATPMAARQSILSSKKSSSTQNTKLRER
ncbi:unnamed protein product [Cyprideis torosa]|uniref:Uncharacterized protein n=1 Tax=Cyprideis torosa TaxID=163714 RepID=A0A7R8ZSB0_9CRUS|nr:unnamed protein product [Cyprideis torosa]CAG0905469.1 unnamed protein product [Cyprideis torosa]